MGCSPLVLILSKDSDIIAPWSDRLTMSREPGLTMSGGGQVRYDGTSKQSENDVAETMPLSTHQAMRYTVRAQSD